MARAAGSAPGAPPGTRPLLREGAFEAGHRHRRVHAFLPIHRAVTARPRAAAGIRSRCTHWIGLDRCLRMRVECRISWIGFPVLVVAPITHLRGHFGVLMTA